MRATLLSLVLSLSFVPPAVSAAEMSAIFNGRDLSGWVVPEPNPFWSVVDGVLVGRSDPERKGSVLRTEKSYGDFVLEFEARWSANADSGVFVRQPELQMQLGTSISRRVDLSGSFYIGGTDPYPEAGRAKPGAGSFTPGGWNRFRLEAKGDTFTVWLNGEPVTRYTNPKYAEPGPIGLQIHNKLDMTVEFRDIRLKVLK